MTIPGGLLGRIFGPAGENTPEGLVSPDLLRRIGNHSLFNAGIGMIGASARPGSRFGETLAKGLGVGQDTYASQLQEAEKQSLLGRKTAEDDRLTTLRADLAAKFAPVDGETPVQKVGRLTDAAAAYAQGNDPETAAKLAQVANALRLQVNSTLKPRYFQQNGKVTRVDPDGTITDIIDDGSLAAKQEIQKANLALREQSVGQAGQRIGLRKLQNFYSRNRKITDWGHALNQAIATISDARGTPLLTSSTIANFVQAADQNARLQIQMLHYMSNIDHSITGWLDVKRSLLTTGKYPPRVYKGLLDHLKKLQTIAANEYNKQLEAESRHDPEAFKSALTADEMFGEVPTDAATPAPDDASSGNPLDTF